MDAADSGDGAAKIVIPLGLRQIRQNKRVRSTFCRTNSYVVWNERVIFSDENILKISAQPERSDVETTLPSI